ncbi:hypothetical protein MCNS_29550 [Mycobacterium conspicuum]|uniref:Uncharacterized protein n=1 Tax=Mycobacterium conspicuum TaxID=44010 RepID=A0A7I7YFK9_9MYCO|nr:hypothetical protein MCNS_29550 [Mycobacterium conspicuum]
MPSGAANSVRRLSWRPTTSTSAARSASASRRPSNRTAAAMLYTGDGPCNWSRNHNRCWANDNGSTAGRSTATSGANRFDSPPTRAANWATEGASNTVRTARPASNA